MERTIIFFWLMLLLTPSFGQDSRASIRGEVELPLQLGNERFVEFMETVVQLDLAVQKPVWKGFAVGLGAKGTYGVLKDRSISGVTGVVYRLVYYGKLSHEWRTTENSSFEISMKVGSSQYRYQTDLPALDTVPNCSGAQEQRGLHIDPSITYNLFANEHTAFSFSLGYENDAAVFGPRQLCLEQFPSGEITEPSGNYGYITIGLGFVAYLGGDRQQRDGF